MGRWVAKRTARSTRRVLLVALLGVLAVAAVARIALAKTSLDTTPPTVSSINRIGGSPTNASSLSWTVSFSESVTGISSSSFQFVTAGSTTGGPISLTGSGSAYTVSTTAGGGDGTILLQLKSAGAFSIKDAAGNALAGTLPFTGQAYTVDRTAPAVPSITAKPASLSNSTSASFAFAGEAGTSFLCKLDGTAYTACSSPQSYSSLAQNGHTFSVEPKDAAGNVGPPTFYSWTIDSVAPVAPTLTTSPDDPNGSAISTFAWSDSESGLTYQCSIENGAFQACTSPTTFTVIVDSSNNGQHQFAVRAIDQAGNVGTTTTYKWKVDKSVGFTITGNAGHSIHPTNAPATSWPTINLMITNPNNFAIRITGLNVTVSANGSCSPDANVEVQQSPASPTNSFTVAANANQVAVPAAFLPRIRLKDLPTTNQNACQGTVFTLNYTGSATK